MMYHLVSGVDLLRPFKAKQNQWFMLGPWVSNMTHLIFTFGSTGSQSLQPQTEHHASMTELVLVPKLAHSETAKVSAQHSIVLCGLALLDKPERYGLSYIKGVRLFHPS